MSQQGVVETQMQFLDYLMDQVADEHFKMLEHEKARDALIEQVVNNGRSLEHLMEKCGAVRSVYTKNRGEIMDWLRQREVKDE